MLATKLQRRILRALEAACAVKLGDDTFVEKWIVHGARGNSQDIAVTFEWSNKDGYVWEVDFSWQSLNEAQISGNEIRLIDSDGEEAIISAFQLAAARV